MIFTVPPPPDDDEEDAGGALVLVLELLLEPQPAIAAQVRRARTTRVRMA
ncbi:MAG: hypothetical protein ACXVFN_13015 [Solirubrobacteraceae bacterium]